MYSGIESSDFVNRVLKFVNVALEHQTRTGANGMYYPCVICGNVSKVYSGLVLREHILRHGFRPQYHVWVWHGEEGVYVEKLDANEVHKEKEPSFLNHTFDEIHDEYENEDDEFVHDDNDGVNEMLDGVADDLGRSSRVF